MIDDVIRQSVKDLFKYFLLPDRLVGVYLNNTHQLSCYRLVGAFLTTHAEFCFVVEDNTGRVCGYSLAAADARDYHRKVEMCWLPAMQEKYPAPPADNDDRQLSPAEVTQRRSTALVCRGNTKTIDSSRLLR